MTMSVRLNDPGEVRFLVQIDDVEFRAVFEDKVRALSVEGVTVDNVVVLSDSHWQFRIDTRSQGQKQTENFRIAVMALPNVVDCDILPVSNSVATFFL